MDLKVNEANKNKNVSLLKTFFIKYIELVKKMDWIAIFLIIATISNIFILSGLFTFIIVFLLDLIAIRITLNSK